MKQTSDKTLNTSGHTVRFTFALLSVFSTFVGCIHLPQRLNSESRAVKNAGQRCFDNSPLQISFLNVGQGDSIFIHCPKEGVQTLIDAGESNEKYPNGETLFLSSFIAKMGEDRVLEHAFNTHPHQDHLFGFLNLLTSQGKDRFFITNYYDNGADNNESFLEESIRKQVSARGGTYHNVTTSKISSLEICPNVTISLYLPSMEVQQTLDCPHNLNDCSLIMKLTALGTSFLLLGDATDRFEQAVLAEQKTTSFLPSTITKIGHHGMASTSSDFLQSVNPDVAIISTGAPGRGTTAEYGFPKFDVISRLDHHFTEKFGPRTGKPLASCIKTGLDCAWVLRPTHQALLSTVNEGTITFHLREGSYCVDSEQNGKLFESGDLKNK